MACVVAGCVVAGCVVAGCVVVRWVVVACGVVGGCVVGQAGNLSHCFLAAAGSGMIESCSIAP